MNLFKRCLAVYIIILFGACSPSNPGGLGASPSEAPEGGSGEQGGSEFGNPVRLIHGELVPSSVGAQLLPISLSSCPADEVVLTNSLAEELRVALDEACRFTLEAPANHAYTLHFEQDDSLQSRLFVETLDEVERYVFFFHDESTPMDLGRIESLGSLATAEFSPLELNDSDKDGLNDALDTDDDNDGILDSLESDCDLDGFIDDYDEDMNCSRSSGAVVLQVSPVAGQTDVAEFEKIKLRLSCAVDIGSIDSSKLELTLLPDNILMICPPVLSAGETVVSCEHPGDPFLAGRTYRAHLKPISCVGGDLIPSTSWEFETASF